MKLADRTVEIHSRGMESNNQFTIAQTSKMFKILSDSLYSDKVMAVIRELSTNAYDAHIAAKNTQPFKVTLPSQANPNFTVRDYGTGLSQQDMEELYTTYGASNKNDSNDFVGCLGLGSKSPFAYTKSFSTTSYYNGRAYNYIAAMDEEGVPSLNLFGITETNEPNGLEISFAVKQYDYTEFAHKAMRIFHYFKMKPIIEGGVISSLNDNSYSRHNYILEGDGWKIGKITSGDSSVYPNTYNNIDTSVVAIMGNIAYPVDASKIIGDKDKEQETSENIQRWNRAFKRADVDNWKNLVREIKDSGLYIEIQFGIGELEMDVSREGLQYTKDVIRNLQTKTSEIYLQLKKDMTTKVAEAKSLIDAYQTYYKLSDLAGGWTAGADWTDSSGKVHTLKSGTDIEYKLAKNKQLYAINFRSAGYRSRRLVYLTDRVHCETLQGKTSYYWDRTTKCNPLAFFRADTASAESAKKIVTKYCNKNDCMAYLMVDSDDHTQSDEGFDQLIKDIGGEENVLKVSDYRSLMRGNSGPRKKRGETGVISKDDIFILSKSKDCDGCAALNGKDLNNSSDLRELSDDLVDGLEDDTIVYVPMTRYASNEGYTSISTINLSMHKDHVFYPIMKNMNIFAIKSSAVEKLKKQGLDMVTFDEWFKPKCQKFIDNISTTADGYDKVVDYCVSQYDTKDSASSNNSYHYYNNRPTDKVIVHTILNIFGLDYRSHIQNAALCDAVDNWMVIFFFSQTVRSGVEFRNISKTDYMSHMASILNRYNMNGLNPTQIRKAYDNLVLAKKTLVGVYSSSIVDGVEISKSTNDRAKTIGKMSDIREKLRNEVDKSPVLKYIVGNDDSAEVTTVEPSNPLANAGGYYANKWQTSVDVDGLKRNLGSLI